MKKFMMSTLLLSLLLTSGCAAIKDMLKPEDSNGEVTFVKSNVRREIAPQLDQSTLQSLAEDNTAFALSFYDQIRHKDGNIIFSPISLSLALSMTMAGADSTTEEAMLDALSLTLPETEIHPAYNAVLQAIDASQQENDRDAEGDQFQLQIANSIWGQSGFEIKDQFLDILAQNYGAGVYNVDFNQDPESARAAINDWVEEETEEKIKELIPPGAINPFTRLVLANAIYFKGSWRYPFSESHTEEAPFTTLEGNEITVDMMAILVEDFLYGKGENYQVISLPYLSSDFAMTVLIPNPGAFLDVESALSPDDLKQIINGMQYHAVDLRMPKFDFETDINANDPLSTLGMAIAFDPERSNFTGIADVDDLYITDVLHKATITVDEQGTEAAAATAVIIGITSVPITEEPIKLVIDRPFLFFIRHLPTGTLLFMGRVANP